MKRSVSSAVYSKGRLNDWKSLGKNKNAEKRGNEEKPVKEFLDNFNNLAASYRSNEMRHRAQRTWSQAFRNLEKVVLPEFKKPENFMDIEFPNTLLPKKRTDEISKNEHANAHHIRKTSETAGPRTLQNMEKTLMKERQEIVKNFLENYEPKERVFSARRDRHQRYSMNSIKFSPASSGMYNTPESDFEAYERELMSRGSAKTDVIANRIVFKIKCMERMDYTPHDHKSTVHRTMRKIKEATESVPLHQKISVPIYEMSKKKSSPSIYGDRGLGLRSEDQDLIEKLNYLRRDEENPANANFLKQMAECTMLPSRTVAMPSKKKIHNLH